MAVDAGTIRSEVRVALDRLRADLRQVDARFDQFAKKQTTTQAKVKTGWRKAFGAINIAGIAAFAAIGLAVKSAVKIFAGFEQSLANVESVAGATAAEMKELEAAALSAGEQTRFSASEAADAMYYLASAGFSAEQSIAALDGVLALATATQSDLAFTSAAVAATISQYGLEAEDATKVSNVFAAAIGNSQATMEKMATAMRNVGPVASALGMSLEQTTGALQSLFDAGFVASQAGVGLRNILSSLAAETDPTVQKLEALGVKFEDVNTSTHSLAEVIGTLNEAGLEAGDVLAAFGRRVGPQILALLKTGQEGIEDYTEAVTDTNAATEAAAIQLDTLQGSFDQLKSIMQSAAIQMISGISPALKGVVDFLRMIVAGFNALPGPIKAFIGIATAAIPVIGGLTLAITLLKAASGLGLVTILSAAVGAIAAVTAVVSNARKEQRAYRDMLYDTRDAMVALTREEQESRRLEFIQRRIELGRQLRDQAQAVRKAEEEAAQAQRDNAQAVRDGNIELWQAIRSNEMYADDLRILSEVMGVTEAEMTDLTAAISVIEGAWEDEREALRSNTQGTDELIDGTEDLAAALLAEAEALQKITDLMDDYREKLEEIGLTDEELLKLDRERALAAVELYEATAEQISRAKALINEYFDAVEEQTAAEERLAAAAEELAETERLAAESARDATAARERAASVEADYLARLEEIGLTTIELIELERARAIATVAGFGATATEIKKATEAINDYYDAIIQSIKADEAAAKSAEKKAAVEKAAADASQDKADAYAIEMGARADANEAALQLETEYQEKLEDRRAGEIALIELQRQRAIAAIEATGASNDAMDSAIAKLNEYFDALRDDASWQRFQDIATTALDYVSQLISNLGALYRATTDRMIDDLDRQLEAELDAIDARLQAALEAAGVAEEITIERLQRELAAAIENGDEETAARLQDEITRAEIQEQYATEQANLEAEFAKDKAQLEYEGALQSWRTQMLATTASAAQMIVNALLTKPFIPAGIAAGALATILGAVQVATVNRSKPDPPAFQTGGIVIGGGASGTTVKVAENNSTEMLLNDSPQGQAFLRTFARAIADEIGGADRGLLQIQMYIDGRKIAESTAEYMNNGIIRIDL